MQTHQNTKFSRNFMSEIAGLVENTDHESVAVIIDRLIETWKKRGWVYSMGNGGSASTASHFVCDLSKYVIPEGKPIFNAMSLSDNIALLTAWANDASFDDIYFRQIEHRIGPNDMLVSWSVHGGSGFSGNLVKAMEYARQCGAFTVSISGFDGGVLHEKSSCSLVVPKDSTPHVEAVHLVYEHLFCARIKEILEQL
jgi:D-sedoheptulose 7-phosphate isomerase